MTRELICLSAALLAAAGLWAQSCPSPESDPATTTSTPATDRAVEPDVLAILQRLEQAGPKHPRIAADVEYALDMLQVGDRQQRTGEVLYQAADEKSPARFRIGFETFRAGAEPKARRRIVVYAFDGQQLTVMKERIKQITRYRVSAEAGSRDLLQLGKGPFPVPFGQKAEAVIEHFQPTTRATIETDPPNSDYLKLVTRPDSRDKINVVWMELWVDRAGGLPVKIVAQDRSENRTTVVFANVKTPESIPADKFHPPRRFGWEYHEEPFRGSAP